MKLSTIFAIAAVSDARKKPKTAASDANKMRRNIQFVWDEWYSFCDNKGRTGRYSRFLKLIDDCQAQVANCGSDPNATSRRRRSDENEEEEKEPQTHEERKAEFYADMEADTENDNGDLKRLNKEDRRKAVKQMGNILKRYGETYLTGCKKGLNPTRVAAIAKNWSQNLYDMGCAEKQVVF